MSCSERSACATDTSDISEPISTVSVGFFGTDSLILICCRLNFLFCCCSVIVSSDLKYCCLCAGFIVFLTIILCSHWVNGIEIREVGRLW